MSLYTPVFPPTDPPAERTPSSSFSSVESHKQQRGLTYSSRLSQWHLAIATLPYELCPSSAPLSPGSQERSAKLQADIEEAVREGRNITDFCKLRSTKLGYATKQPSHSSLEQGDGIPWILAETEEEWFEWEREAADRRGRRKGKERANVAPPPPPQSQDAHDKVLDWKAGLVSPSSSLVTASPAAPAGTARSSLGFPVVKRSTAAKGAKLKSKTASSLGPIPRTKPDLQADGEQHPALRVESKAINAVRVDTGNVEHRNSFSGSKQDPPSEAKAKSPIAEESEEIRQEVYDLSAFPPPSFPADLVTSTQKNTPGPIRPLDSPQLSLVPDAPGSIPDHADNVDTIVLPSNNKESEKNKPIISEDHVAGYALPIEQSSREDPQPTPPSPPLSSETSQQHTEIQQSNARTGLDIMRLPTTTPPRDRATPLTPPPEAQVEKSAPTATVSSGMQSSPPHTPQRFGRALPEKNLLDVPCAGPYGGHGGFVNGHITPEAAINGATVVRTAMGAVVDVPSLPRTPERNRQVLPDPLTTSRKSRPRPRPPSRKHSVQNMDVDINLDVDGVGASEAGGDPSPAKSERSYFSSPASGSSSSGSDFSRGSMLFVPGSPTSPLGFTQNPTRFAPLAHSTQMSSSKVPPPLQHAPGSPLASRAHFQPQFQIQTQTQTRSQKQLGPGTGMGTGTGNTSMNNYYNSQFDVDARVDQLSNFMRQDVDLDAWVRSTNTSEADEDEDAVAHLVLD